MTPKLRARIKDPRRRYSSNFTHLIAENGDVFTPLYVYRTNLNVGDKVWIGKRLNVPATDWCYEVYQITLEQSPSGRVGTPKTWFGKTRKLLEKL